MTSEFTVIKKLNLVPSKIVQIFKKPFFTPNYLLKQEKTIIGAYLDLK